MVQIVEVTRGYSNYQEEGRVKAGTRFAVEKASGDLRVISQGRYKALVQSGLVRNWDVAGAAAPLHLTATPGYAGHANAHVTQPIKTAARSAAKAKQEVEPKEPRPLANPAGGKTTAKPSSSSSAAAHQSSNVTLGSRGKRRSRSSASTTPSNSLHGATASTPATADGGASTKARPNSKG